MQMAKSRVVVTVQPRVFTLAQSIRQYIHGQRLTDDPAGTLRSEPARGAKRLPAHARRTGRLALSLQYHNIARYLFILLIFSGLVSTGWFGIPLLPRYFVEPETDIVAGLFTLFSALGTIWGVMAYREFTRSASSIIEARLAARRLDPMVGEYEYKSYNPSTKEYDEGFVPSGPVDFWDKETHVPPWMDKGKYWHILLSLQHPGREILLQVVRDRDLPFSTGRRNAAVTQREKAGDSRQYRYIVKVPQWLVMNTERGRFSDLQIDSGELSALIADVNMKIVAATNEVAGWERLRVRFPWRFMTFGIYLNKSLPLRIVYRQVIRNFPGAKERKIDQTNANLANVPDEELVAAAMELARAKDILPARIDKLYVLVRFLKTTYTRMGLGEGASEYHNFHHSLEVSCMAMQMLPGSFRGFAFGAKEYEIMLVAGLLHDYDPDQPLAPEQGKIKGPSVIRTMEELKRTRIIDAYFTMNAEELGNYFREYGKGTPVAIDFSTTHPEYVKSNWTPVEGIIVEALVWRTDFPFFKLKNAQEKFDGLLGELARKGENTEKIRLMSEVLWLADLAVTYMGSDPVRAWDRVTNLYDELFLPRLEAVSRTDAFFSDFADLELFRDLLAQKTFPDVFRQRWNLIYQFFHEGNPSTPLNRTIQTARSMYHKVNVEVGMRRGELLQAMAAENWSEYFIGIGRDQNEVLKAKSRLAALDPQNASAFWGDVQKLLPAIMDDTIDNFLMVMPEREAPVTGQERGILLAMFATFARKMRVDGMVKILTDIEEKSDKLKALLEIAASAGLAREAHKGKDYFPEDWRDPEFKNGQRLVLTLVPRTFHLSNA
jgi:tRNA G46 methylase TrmB